MAVADVQIVDETPRTVLAVYAHPDDPDISAGGTLARWAGGGAEVHVCICTEGDKGTIDASVDPQALVAVRREEVAAAGRALGVHTHHWLGLPDGGVVGPDLPARLVSLIRSVRPDVVVAPDPTAVFFDSSYVNHMDHRAVGWLVLDAVSPGAAMPHYFPGEGSPHRVGALYLSDTHEPDVWVDVAASVDAKAAAIGAHRSQVGEAGDWVRTAVRDRAAEAGRRSGLAFAEAFRRIVFAAGP